MTSFNLFLFSQEQNDLFFIVKTVTVIYADVAYKMIGFRKST